MAVFKVIDHKFRIPHVFPVSVHLPLCFAKIIISPTLKILLLFSKNSPAFYILYAFFVPPTLTMMHLCIAQCTYWAPLFLGAAIMPKAAMPIWPTES